MDDDLSALRDSLSTSLEELLNERDVAFAAGETAKVTTAEAEAERIGTVLATVEFAINNTQALNINAVATRLQASVQAQRAVGLSTAAQTIADAVGRLGTGGGGGGGGGASGGGSTGGGGGGGGGTGGGGPSATGDIQAKPGPLQTVVNKLIAGAKAHQLDPMTILTIVAIESDLIRRLPPR